jgi:CheY-like chemotaxis protein
VLVAEDNPFNRELLVQMLAAEGREVVEARDGREALDLLESREFDLIFMDILMPRMGGIEAIHRVRKAGVTTPIVIVSALSSRADRRRCREAGGDAFLPKPVEPERVQELLRRFARQPPGPRTLADPAARAPLNFADYRALLVDPDPRRARRIRTLLARIGFAVSSREAGEAAWKAFGSRPYRYHFLVSHVFLPDIDGLGLLARVREDFDDVPVFIVTETVDPDTAALAAELGASGVVAEPDLEETLPGLMESAAYRYCPTAACDQPSTTARQVRQAQAHLTRMGCDGGCPDIDIAHLPLSDAGGDLALCRRLDDGACGGVLGDVAGHSVIASYFSAIFLGMLTSAWPRHPDPGDLIRALNRKLTREDYDAHLCAAAVRWRKAEGRLQLAVAGLPGGLRVRPRPDGTVSLTETAGGGLCMGLLDREELFLEEEIALRPGDWLFLHTDGVRRDALVAALMAEPDLRTETGIAGVGRRLLERVFRERAQDDDAALMTFHAPDAPASRHTLASSYSAVDAACRWAGKRLDAAGLPAGVDRAAVTLALREALNNAVEHGNGFDADKTVELDIWRDSDRLLIRVADQGPGPPARAGSADIDQVPPAQRRGRGLPTLRSLASRVTVDGGRITLVFE